MGCRIHFSMKPIIPLYYGHSDFSPSFTMTLNWIPVKDCDPKAACVWFTSITLEFKKQRNDEDCESQIQLTQTPVCPLPLEVFSFALARA